MPITFKSQATGDLVMLNQHAEALLQLLGKTSTAPGIIEVADMPQALSVFRAIPDPREDAHKAHAAEALTGDTPEDGAEEAESPKTLSFQDEPVSLRQRAAPFIRLIEQAQAEGKPIVWGV